MFSRFPCVRADATPPLRFSPLALALLLLGGGAQAASPHHTERVIVTGNPLGSESFALAPAVSVLEGRELTLRRESSLGETVSGLPGVSSSYFGPNASRPVIRGLDGDRIRLLEDGIGASDASNLSFDHATTSDPLLIDRIEVLRGPAALLYGGNAIGGVVNAIDHRIPQQSPEGVGGRAEVRLGGAAEERSAAAMLDAGGESFALHVDAFSRDTRDLRIPGRAVSAPLQARVDAGEAEVAEALTTADGRLPNSASQSQGGALGASWVGSRGYLGMAVSRFDTEYGVVAEPEVSIDMRSERIDLAGELKAPLPGFTALKGKLRHTDYQHTELDAGTPATLFSSKGWEARAEASHAPLAGFNGVIGLTWSEQDFAALGDEAFVPSTTTRNSALLVFEETTLGAVKFSAGGRYEHSEVVSAGGERFGAAEARSFNLWSGALGTVWNFAAHWALAANLAHSARAPTFYELFANGPHAATGAYEVGDTQLDQERSNALDLFLRYKAPGLSFSVGGYLTRFSNYLALSPSGQWRGSDGSYLADPSAADEALPEYTYLAVPAEFKGLEAELSWRMAEVSSGRYTLGLKGDLVRAKRRDNNTALPRIAPARATVSLDWELAQWAAQVQLQHVLAQNRTAAEELPTAAYSLLNLALSYRLKGAGANWEAWLKGSNLTDAEARNHASFLKDVAPLGGRAVLLGLRSDF